jgi:hypothetical protein
MPRLSERTPASDVWHNAARLGLRHLAQRRHGWIELWTEPGGICKKPGDIGIDSFQADRAPDHTYKS